MGVTIMHGDIFTTQAQVIGHGVNTQGLMGNGIARTIRIMYPSAFKAYQQACDDGTLYGGQCLIANIASQVLPGAEAKLHLLAEGLDNMFLQMEQLGLNTVALPRIGAGVGGLHWDEVLYTIKEAAKLHPGIDVEVWEFSVR
jgi:O-acetyl-ADP-ribose deacetylase (regulator of RNase III)